MFTKDTRIAPLQLRKQLLLVESELNRAQFSGDLAAMKAGIRARADDIKSIRSILSSAVALAAGLGAFLHGKVTTQKDNSSWLQTLLKGAGLISSLWMAFRPQKGTPKDN
jgi:hypothetical protein